MFTNLLRNRVAAISVAGALAVGLIGGGAAFAMSGESSSTSTPAPAVFQAHSDASPTVPSTASGARSGRHPIARGLYADVVKQSGLTKAELQTGFKAGQSV
ncbi:MAG: hypothetical protein ACRDG3_09460, partial [Tepidiformaceae bacterium]